MEGFLRHPLRVQRWYAERRALMHEKEPNPGHRALVELERLVPAFTLVTQNVDGLHRRAGARAVVELHGALTRTHCVRCRRPAKLPAPEALQEGPPVACETCGGYIRPDVVWFGEMLPEGALERAYEAARRADVFLSIGTSAVVYPAAEIPLVAVQHGAYVAEVNIEATSIASRLDEVVLGKAGDVLPHLVAAVRRARR